MDVVHAGPRGFCVFFLRLVLCFAERRGGGGGRRNQTQCTHPVVKRQKQGPLSIHFVITSTVGEYVWMQLAFGYLVISS